MECSEELTEEYNKCIKNLESMYTLWINESSWKSMVTGQMEF